MSISYTYMDAIGIGYPNVGCHCTGNGSIYNDMIYDNGDSIPSQDDLDNWIISRIKNDMWLLIQQERDRRKLTGGYKVGNYWFHSDNTSRIQQLGLVMLGVNMPSGIMWKTMSGEFVPMTPTLAGQIFQAAALSDISVFSIAEQKKTTMIASTDPATYDYLSGWQPIYGE